MLRCCRCYDYASVWIGLLMLLLWSIGPWSSTSFSVKASSSSSSSSSSSDGHDILDSVASELIEWFRSNGGYMHDKLEIRRQTPGDPTSPTGVFATGDVENDERLFTFPKHLHLAVPSPEDIRHNQSSPYKDVDDLDDYHFNLCRLARRLLEETKLYRESPSSSKFAPYIRYLEETQPKGQLPATYSKEGKHILRKIQNIEKESTNVNEYWDDPSPLPPWELVDWIDVNFQHCFDEENALQTNADARHAVAIVVQRGYDLELIPIWDLANHDVLDRINTETSSLRDDDQFVVWATRDINAGEELFYTYNFCADCNDVGSIWGTPGMYRDFGFVEDYPQEWPFLDQNVFAQVIEREEDNNTTGISQYYARFYSEPRKQYGQKIFAPNRKKMKFFRKQHARLVALDIPTELQQVVPAHERFWIQKYYDSLVIAISTVIEAGAQYLDLKRRQAQANEQGDNDEL